MFVWAASNVFLPGRRNARRVLTKKQREAKAKGIVIIGPAHRRHFPLRKCPNVPVGSRIVVPCRILLLLSEIGFVTSLREKK